MELYEKSVTELYSMLIGKEISSHELTGEFLKRIRKINKSIGAYITVCEENALYTAREADKLINGGKASSLTGIPFSVKDNICTKDVKTTCASKMLKSYIPPYNASVCETLENMCVPVLGKTNLDEFAMGSTGETSALLQTKNPINPEYSAGGSSCGPAAALRAGLCAASIGSDTGGSVRIPASFCGLCGFKPSYGAISRYGLIAYASSLDHIGLICRNATDAEAVFTALAKKDRRDMTSVDMPLEKCETANLKNIKIAYSEGFLKNTAADIAAVFENAVSRLASRGAKMLAANIAQYERLNDIYRVISCAEATSNLARYDGIKYGESGDVAKVRTENFGDEVKCRILFGNYVLSKERYEAVFETASRARARIEEETENVFKTADVLISPVCDENVPRLNSSKECKTDTHTTLANLCGIPAVSIPVGKDKNGMPVSVQLMSQKYSDMRLLSIAKAVERGLAL